MNNYNLPTPPPGWSWHRASGRFDWVLAHDKHKYRGCFVTEEGYWEWGAGHFGSHKTLELACEHQVFPLISRKTNPAPTIHCRTCHWKNDPAEIACLTCHAYSNYQED
jgi:hypothetical protein